MFTKILTLFLLTASLSAHSLDIYAHRGGRAIRSENTMAAFSHVLANSIDHLELDLTLTKDRVLVVYHDEALNPDICLDSSLKPLKHQIKIQNLTVAELKKFDCGKLVHPEFQNQIPSPGEKIPTFSEFLQEVEDFQIQNNKKIQLNIELKIHNSFYKQNIDSILSMFFEQLSSFSLENQIILQSFNPEVLLKAKTLHPELRTSLLVKSKFRYLLKLLGLNDYVALAKKYKIDILSPHYRILSKQDIVDLHANDIQVIPWTLNSKEVWSKFIGMDVDGIITDDPLELKKFINEN